MKFRALAWDYHAEAALVESEKIQRQQRQQPCTTDARDDAGASHTSLAVDPRISSNATHDAASLTALSSSNEAQSHQPVDSTPSMLVIDSSKQNSRMCPPSQERLPANSIKALQEFDETWNRVNRFPLLLNHPTTLEERQQRNVNEPAADTAVQPNAPLLQFALQVAWTLHCSKADEADTTAATTSTGSSQGLRSGGLPSTNHFGRPPDSTATVTGNEAQAVTTEKRESFIQTMKHDYSHPTDNMGSTKDSSLETLEVVHEPSHLMRDRVKRVSAANATLDASTLLQDDEEQENHVSVPADNEDSKPHETVIDNNPVEDDSLCQPRERGSSEAGPSTTQFHYDDDSDDSFWQRFDPGDSFGPAVFVNCDRNNSEGDDAAKEAHSGGTNPDAGSSHADTTTGGSQLPLRKKSRVSFENSEGPVPLENHDSAVATEEGQPLKSIKKRKSKDKKRKDEKKRSKKDDAKKDRNDETARHGEPVVASSDPGGFMKAWKQRAVELQKSRDTRLHAKPRVPKTQKKEERLPTGIVTASKKRFRSNLSQPISTIKKTGSMDMAMDNSRQLTATFSYDDSINSGRNGPVNRVSMPGLVATNQRGNAPRTASFSHSDSAHAHNVAVGTTRQTVPNPVPLPQMHHQQQAPKPGARRVTSERLRFEESYTSKTPGNLHHKGTIVTPAEMGPHPHPNGEPGVGVTKLGRVPSRNQPAQNQRQQIGVSVKRSTGPTTHLPNTDHLHSSGRSQMPREPAPSRRMPPSDADRGHGVSVANIMSRPVGSWQESEPVHPNAERDDFLRNAFDVSGALATATEGQEIVRVFCAERFVESWPNVVGELSSTGVRKEGCNGSFPSQIFEFLDTPLVDQCSVDIELSSKSAIMICPISLFTDRNTSRDSVIDIAALVATGRYENLFLILVLSGSSSSAQESSAELQLHAATIQLGSSKSTSTHIKTATSDSLPESIAEIILAANVASDQEANIPAEPISPMLAQRARFLLSMVPTMSLSGAIQAMTIAGELNGEPSVSFADTIASEQTRQQISLRASSTPSKAADVPAKSMIQLSHASRANLSRKLPEANPGV